MPNITLTQNVALTQNLTHDMTQKLAVLQTPTLELAALVRQQLELNPVLEAEDNGPAGDISLEEAGLDEESDALWEEKFRQLAQLDSDWRAGSNGVSTAGEDAERHQLMMDSLTKPVTLTEHIGNQIHAMRLDEEERADVLRLLGYLNDNGWMAQPMEEVAAAEGRPLEDLEFAREVLLSLDPAGLGALDLRECLMVQLKRDNKTKTLEYHMLNECFDALSKRRFEDIAEKLDVEVEDVVDATERLTVLNPRPARLFDQTPGAGVCVEPELTIEKVDGVWTVTVHREYTPSIRISNTCKNMLNAPGGGKDVREYLREHIRKGRFFISCLEQRRETIRKVAMEILSRQQAFFEEGPSHLKPMTMADVAQVIGVHETTISRTVGGKFARTPFGVFELRSFFTSGMATHSGEAVSSRTVEAALREIVAAEDGSRPLSDAEISQQMSDRGIRISRRTVVKYRDRLGILAGSLRRKHCSRAAA